MLVLDNNVNVKILGEYYQPLGGLTPMGQLIIQSKTLEKQEKEEIESALCKCCQDKKQSIISKYLKLHLKLMQDLQGVK